MNILTKTEHIRGLCKKHGQYQLLSEKTDISSSWLAKFANNKLHNPGVKALASLENYFGATDDQAAA